MLSIFHPNHLYPRNSKTARDGGYFLSPRTHFRFVVLFLSSHVIEYTARASNEAIAGYLMSLNDVRLVRSWQVGQADDLFIHGLTSASSGTASH